MRDNEKKRHPLIVPFDDLPPQQAAKDENNVKEALNQSVARHEEAADAPCWLKVFRVGVIGPLAADATALRPGLAAAVDRLLAQVDRLDQATLEVLTPNAPGFDRIAALLIAGIWKVRVGRPCQILTFEAAHPPEMDLLAGAAANASPDQMQAQTRALQALRGDGHRLRVIDLRPLGCSDVELAQERDRYFGAVEAAQHNILRLADAMIFGKVTGAAGWTDRAIAAWQDKGKLPILIDMQPASEPAP